MNLCTYAAILEGRHVPSPMTVVAEGEGMYSALRMTRIGA
jgi:hypothetical protein